MKMLQLIQKTRFAIAYPIVASIVVFANTSEATMLWGFILALIGEGIRLWANGYIGHKKVNRTRKDEGEAPIGSLITAGPYAHLRHPLYFGTFMILLGICVAAGHVLFLLFALGIFLPVYNRKMNEEDALLCDEIGVGYSIYKKAVPRWVPRFPPYEKQRGIWSWQGIGASKEWKTVLWISVFFIILYLREEFYQEHEFFTEAGELPKHIFFLCMMLALIAGDLLIMLKRKLSTRPSEPFLD